MSELMKTPNMENYAEIRLLIPQEKQFKVRAMIESLLDLAEVRYSIPDEVNEDGFYSLEQVFPDLHAGSAIKGLRYREKLTQIQLARKLGVKRHHISEMENGKRTIGKEMAKRLADALNTDYKVFLPQDSRRTHGGTV